MSVSNRQRRAAKKRKQGKARRASGGGQPLGATGWGAPDGWDGAFTDCDCPGCRHGTAPGQVDEQVLASVLLEEVMQELARDPEAAPRRAASLLRSDGQVAPAVAVETVQRLLDAIVPAVCGAGWAPSDLAEITSRRLSLPHLPVLAALLGEEAARHAPHLLATAWSEDLAALGRAEPADLLTPTGLSLVLGLAALLATLPAIAAVLPPPGSPPGSSRRASGPDGKVLAKVRSLLAKAESTAFPEEAEALSAKAQELISRHALGRLMEQAQEAGVQGEVVARRIWIEAPYVMAKALLVAEVADANRCRAVASEQLGFSTVLGQPDDLDAVELVATSLLVQANFAMLSCGRQSDRQGRSRTASFRRAFLTAYATRIGERLRAADEHAVAETGRSGELVPILQRQSEQVHAATEQMFPHLISRGARITNAQGWAAGRVAADLASLDTSEALEEATG